MHSASFFELPFLWKTEKRTSNRFFEMLLILSEWETQWIVLPPCVHNDLKLWKNNSIHFGLKNKINIFQEGSKNQNQHIFKTFFQKCLIFSPLRQKSVYCPAKIDCFLLFRSLCVFPPLSSNRLKLQTSFLLLSKQKKRTSSKNVFFFFVKKEF